MIAAVFIEPLWLSEHSFSKHEGMTKEVSSFFLKELNLNSERYCVKKDVV